MKNIFVSSTFRDMQAERDLIQKEVLPQLRSKAREYGENINMIDLRWGVDTSELESEEGSMKVMSVCLDEVERSRPYMLIFLGERYGSIIAPEITERVIARKDSDFKLDDYAISITAMEVEFGALSRQFDSLENCVVCMRNFSPAVISDENERAVYRAEDEERAKKQQAFKERIMEKVQGRVIEYTCDWDEQKKQLINFRTMDGDTLCDRLLITYEKMFKEEWIIYNKLSWEEKEQLAVNALVESKLRTFSGREQLIEKYYDRIINENGVLILQGEVGSGKTSIMCKLMERLEQNGKKVFRFVAGNSSMSETAMQLVQQMVYYLENIQGISHYGDRLRVTEQPDRYQDWIERMEELAAKLNEGEKVYFIIDALDQMYLDESVKNLDFLILNSKLRYVLSATDQFEVASKYKAFNMVVEPIPLLDAADAKEVMDGILRASSKNTYREMQRAILAKKSSNKPLYISMLIQRLNMMGMEELYRAWTESEIIAQVTETIVNMPDDVQAAAVYLLEEAIVRLDSQNSNLREVIKLIGVSKDGLREKDIQVILHSLGYEVRQLDISRLLHYLDSFFVIHEDGRIDFSHKVIREGIRANADNEQYRKAIADRVKALDSSDNFWKREGMYYARMTRDIALAEEIIRYAYEHKEQMVQDAIKSEGLADEGDFYCENLMTCEGAIPFFASDLASLLDIRKEEAQLQEKIGKQLIKCLEERYLENGSIGIARCLSVSCANVSHTLLEQGKLEEALVYAKMELAAYKEIRRIEPCLKNLRGVSVGYEDVGHVYMQLDEAKKALSYYEKALEIAEQVYQISELKQALYELSVDHYNVGRALKKLEKLEQARLHLEEALKIEEECSDWKSLRFLALVYEELGDIRKAQSDSNFIDYYKKALEIVEKIYKHYPSVQGLRDLADANEDVGEGFFEQGKIEKAIEYYEHLLETKEAIYKACRNPRSLHELGVTYGNTGKIKSANGEWVSALGHFMTAADILEEYHNINPNVAGKRELAIAYENIGYALNVLENTEDMLEYYNKSQELLEEVFGISKSEQDLRDVISSYTYVGDLLSKTKMWEKATYYYEKSKEKAEELCKMSEDAKNLWYLTVSYDNLARALRQQRKTSALDYFEKTAAVRCRIANINRTQRNLSELASSYNNVGHVLSEYGKKVEALDYYKMALDVALENYEARRNRRCFHDFVDRYRKLESALKEQGIIIDPIDISGVCEEEMPLSKVLTWYVAITKAYQNFRK